MRWKEPIFWGTQSFVLKGFVSPFKENRRDNNLKVKLTGRQF